MWTLRYQSVHDGWTHDLSWRRINPLKCTRAIFFPRKTHYCDYEYRAFALFRIHPFNTPRVFDLYPFLSHLEERGRRRYLLCLFPRLISYSSPVLVPIGIAILFVNHVERQLYCIFNSTFAWLSGLLRTGWEAISIFSSCFIQEAPSYLVFAVCIESSESNNTPRARETERRERWRSSNLCVK